MADNTKTALVLGGIGLGILAIIAFSSPAESRVQVMPPPPPPRPPPPSRMPGPPPPLPNQGTADAIAAAIAAATAAATMPTTPSGIPTSDALPVRIPPNTPLPNPIPFVQGQRYRTRIELSGIQTFGNRDDIQKVFEGFGFSNVMVYMNAGEVPAGWPQAALMNVTGGSRWAEGTWNRPSQVTARPPQIQNAWTA